MTKENMTLLRQCLKELHLPVIRECYEEQAAIARQESLSYERYLLDVMERERETRRTNRINRMVRESKLPLEKTMEAFERKRLPQKVNLHVSLLIEGDFLNRCENILIFGNPGSGKTHLLCAIGHELLQRGWQVLYRSCSLLVQELLQAKKDLTLQSLFKRFSRFDALIIDDLGYVRQNRDEMEVLFTLLADRYERGTVMLTSNLPFSQWESIFKDPMTTAAAIDRLVHHSVILELNLPSYRLEHSMKNNSPIL